MEYLEELWKTFTEQPINILCTSFLLWAIFPAIIFSISGIGLLLNIINLETFTNFFVNAIVPWWASIIMNFFKFILEYLFSLIITIILVNHNLLETINFKELMRRLQKI